MYVGCGVCRVWCMIRGVRSILLKKIGTIFSYGVNRKINLQVSTKI